MLTRCREREHNVSHRAGMMPTPKRIDYVDQERKLFFHWHY
ncbi:hypothetical protein MVUOKPPV_CDS0278 [Klebsiella phage phi1_175008]|uniref:Uncharacterized protein n=1 Tax=Klebsiella phage phi1_175008 TaxID=3127744 RepID=A0ACD5FRH9_9CAUD